MNKHIYLLLTLVSCILQLQAATDSNSRRSYVKTIHSDIYTLTKQLDHLMHRKAFEHNPTNLKNIHARIKDIRYKRDILMQHLYDLKRHNFSQMQQL